MYVYTLERAYLGCICSLWFFGKTMPTTLSKNPRNGIKSSNWATHRTWYVGIGQVASANGMRHQRRHERIWCGMCAFSKGRRPTACSISQGLHASAVACEHRLGNIILGLHASAKSCTHQPWCVGIWKTTSANWMQHQPRPLRIDKRHQSWPARIG